MADELLDQIEDNASAPAKASDDAGSMEQHSLRDQIAFHKYRAAAGITDPRKALLRFKIANGGAV
jgi:hypothetical protein